MPKRFIDWTESQFDWTEILEADPESRIIKTAYRLVKGVAKMMISQYSYDFVLQQVRPNGKKFYTHFVLRGFVFCTFLPNCISRHFPQRCVRIEYSNGHLDMLVKGLAVNFRVEEIEEAEFVSEEAAKKYYKLEG